MKTIFKAFIILTNLLLGVSSLNAQNFEWVKSFGKNNEDIGYSLCTDASGNVYTTGTFQGIIDFDPGPGTYNLTSAGNHDIFVQKMDASGNLLWARAFGGISGGQSYGYAICVDASENVYTTGSFAAPITTQSVDFDPGPGTYYLNGYGGAAQDIFVHKMDASGNFLWAKQFQGGSHLGKSINVDASGNVYTTGYFIGLTDFDPGPGTTNLNTAGFTHTFVHKMDASGNFLWVKSFGQTSTSIGSSTGAMALDSAVDAEGNVFTTGHFMETTDFDPGLGTYNITAWNQDIFVQKLDASGNFIWAKTIGGQNDEQAHSIKIDAAGDIYTTGIFWGTVDFDPGPETVNIASVGGTSDIFVLKMDASGSFIWAKAFGGTGDDAGRSITVDDSGVYTTGYFQRTADFDPGSGTYNIVSAGVQNIFEQTKDVFVQKMDNSGNFLWAKSFAGTSNDEVYSIAVDASANVYTTGSFIGTVDFAPGPQTANRTSVGGNDIFIHKMSQGTEVAGYIFVDSNANGINDLGEVPVPIQTIIYNNGNDIAITNENGFFRAFPPQGEQTFSVQLPTYYTNTTPLTQTVDVQLNIIDTLYFGIQPISDVNDLVVDVHPYTSPRPGFTRNYQINYQNVGTTTLDDVTLKFLKTEEDNIDFATGTYTVSNDTLIWNLGTLEPFSHGSFTITNTLSATATLGDSTLTQAWIVPLAEDATTENNIIVLNEEIIGSYDPNDKTVTPEVSEPTENEPLEYVVRFQNTGNHQADFVIVRDTLSTLLDLTTFQMIAASHNYELAIENRIAVWTFPQINLPDSTSDEPGSHGFIKFKVQRMDGLGVGTQIPNRVGIYFDYNAPVITNTCIYSIETCISTGIDVITACNNYTWIDGNTYNASNNTATYTIDNAAGCDSIVTLNLTVVSPTNAVDVQTACGSYTWIDGNTYTSSNNLATHTIANAAGCDSTITLNLTITNPTSAIDTQTACNNYTWIDGNTYTSSNNTATHVLENAAGCDSIVTLNLTIHTVSNIGTTLNGATVSANNNNATYQWLDCDNNNEPIEGATSQTFTASESGNYAVEVTENGCTNTSACVAVTIIGVDELSNGLQAAVYPNPSQGNVEITLGSAMQDVELMLTDIQGRVIFTRNYPSLYKTNIALPDAKGVYVLKLKAQDSTSTLRLVKE